MIWKRNVKPEAYMHPLLFKLLDELNIPSINQQTTHYTRHSAVNKWFGGIQANFKYTDNVNEKMHVTHSSQKMNRI